MYPLMHYGIPSADELGGTERESTMYELHITSTGKSFSPKARYSIFDESRKSFPDMDAVYKFLREQYGRAKRQPMYRDRKDGPPIKCGWVVGFRNADWSHSPVQHWLQQDWIELRCSEVVAL